MLGLNPLGLPDLPALRSNWPIDSDAQGRPLPSVAPFLGRRSSLLQGLPFLSSK